MENHHIFFITVPEAILKKIHLLGYDVEKYCTYSVSLNKHF